MWINKAKSTKKDQVSVTEIFKLKLWRRNWAWEVGVGEGEG